MDHEWQTKKPPENRALKVFASDYMGEFEYVAEWIPYKNQPGKGRWMQRNERRVLERVQRKELPEKWRELTRDEFMEYYGLGEEDMRQDI